MKRLKVLIIILTLISLPISCENDEDKLSNRELLMANSWIRISMKENGVEVYPDALYSCHDDDIWTFWTDGTLTVDPGIIKCHENDTISSGTWQLTLNEETLMFIIQDENWIFKISELTKSKLVLSIEREGIIAEIIYIPS